MVSSGGMFGGFRQRISLTIVSGNPSSTFLANIPDLGVSPFGAL